MPDSTATSTSPADSLTMAAEATDSAVVHSFMPAELGPRTCHEVDAPRIIHLRNSRLGRPAYSQGIIPEARATLPGYDSGVMVMLILLFLIISSNFRHYSTFIKTFAQDLFSVRRRANAFDENHTMSETRVQLSLVTVVCVCEGILLFTALNLESAALTPFAGVAGMTLICALYYVCQLMAYRTVGYLFTSSVDTVQWLKGFNASQSLLGLGLIIPALLTLFDPGAAPLLLSVSLFLYGMARIIFISKGFRIFYSNYTSLVYFILYLCTLEFIPPVILYRLASYISFNF